MKQPAIKTTFTRSQRGLSLIELMISITIGLLILVSLSSLFINQSKARAELDKSNRMIDNGRYALQLLSNNLRMAGFFDRYSPSGTAVSLPDPCNTEIMVDTEIIVSAITNLDLLLLHVQGYDAASSTATISSPTCSLTNTAGNTLSLKPGSDILVMRRAGGTASTQATAPENGTIHLQVSSCQYDVPVAPNPATATPYIMSTSKAALTLGQMNLPSGSNCTSSLGVATITAPLAPVRPFMVEVYFVSPDNNVGDGIPTLKRRELTNDGANPVFVTTPLVEGIEFMQIEYGIDNPLLDTDNINGPGLDGVADAYTSCATCTMENWSNVVSVKLHLIARNTDQTKGYTDTKTYTLGSGWTYTPSGTAANYKRHSYTQLVRLINPAGRREVP